MITKKCSKCCEIRTTDEFHKNKRNKDGLQEYCKVCRKKTSELNKEILSEYKKKWYLNNSEKIKKRINENYHNKKDEINSYRREKYLNDIELHKLRRQKYYDKNKDKIIENNKKWAKNNREKVRNIHKNHRNTYQELLICRRILYRTIKYLGGNKEFSTIEILGYSPNDLKIYLENLFTDGMNWDNYGEWHVDHIKPISSFEKNTNPKIINQLSNLQPLWAFDNLSKGSKLNL